MKRKIKQIVVVISFLTYSLTNFVSGTPSTQVWIPSTDIQGFKTFHLGIDNYIRTANDIMGLRGPGMYDIGLTTGFLPFNKLQGEVGVDYLSMGDIQYDDHPIYFNLKLGVGEDSLFKFCPAIVVGAYNVGLKKNLTDYNIMYGEIAKSIPILGRVSVGYYMGSATLLLDDNRPTYTGKKANAGLLLSLDRTMTEISDKLWIAIDYQGGQNYLGGLSFGASWAFSKNVSVIFGYDIWTDKNVLYNTNNYNANSFTTQLDINF
jgi:hypothetical protein